jgi:hypothetical protein
MSHSILSRALMRYKAGVACCVSPFNLEMFPRPRVHCAGLMLHFVELWVRLFTKPHWLCQTARLHTLTLLCSQSSEKDNHLIIAET